MGPEPPSAARFLSAEDRPGGGHLVVISYGLWQRRFGRDPGIIGKPLPLGGEPYTVIGVLDAGYAPDPPADLWMPLQADVNSTDQAHYLRAAARLKPGVTLQQANAALGLAAARYHTRFPDADGPDQSFGAESLQDATVGNVRPALLILLATVGFVLLIACANVANLLLARATGRSREIAIRAALGAGRGRIIRQLLTESVLLASIGGVIGLFLGYAGVRALLAFSPGNIPRIGVDGAAVTLDWRVLLFTVAMAILTGVVFGLVPALHASRPDLHDTLKESASRSGSGLRQNRLRSLLVVSEMALAMVLLVGAGLLIRTFVALRQVVPGFDRHNVLVMETSLTGSGFDTTAAVARLTRQAIERIEALPGVEAAAVTCSVPLEPSFGLPFVIEGRPPTNGPSTAGGAWRYATPRYFDVFKIPILRGRSFTDRDDGAAPGVVLINETMARRFWPKQDPLGQRISIGKGVGPEFEEPPREIVGVVQDVLDAGLDSGPGNIMYIPLAQVKDGVMALNNRIIPITWAVRTKVEPYSLAGAIERQIQAAGNLPVANIRSMDRVLAQSTARNEFNALLLAIFAGSALLLAAIGIYGLMGYTVEQRAMELGIRIALGADSRNVRNLVMAQAMLPAAIGIAIGLGAAFALTRLMASLLFSVKPTDPLVFGAVAALLLLVALAASYFPARRATGIDPVVALRYE